MQNELTWENAVRRGEDWIFAHDKNGNVVGGVVKHPDTDTYWAGLCHGKWASSQITTLDDAKKYILMTHKLTNRSN